MTIDQMTRGDGTRRRGVGITDTAQTARTAPLERAPTRWRGQLDHIIRAQLWGDVGVRFQNGAQQNIGIGMEWRLINCIGGPNFT